MASKVALLLFLVLEHTKWSLAFAACRLGRKIQKVFCPIRSECLLGRLELVRTVFVPRDSYFYFALLLVEFFPARLDFVFCPTNCSWVSEDDYSTANTSKFTETVVVNYDLLNNYQYESKILKDCSEYGQYDGM